MLVGKRLVLPYAYTPLPPLDADDGAVSGPLVTALANRFGSAE